MDYALLLHDEFGEVCFPNELASQQLVKMLADLGL
jgi:hypothetical protein